MLVKDVIPKHLEATTAKLVEAGCKVEEFDDAVRIISDGKLHHTQVTTLPYPGFPTDMQPQMAVILGIAEGTSTVTESIFENRFKYVDELTRMGSQYQGREQYCHYQWSDPLYRCQGECAGSACGSSVGDCRSGGRGNYGD